MDALKVDVFLMANANKLPEEKLPSLEDSKAAKLTTIHFKNPTTALILSIFFNWWSVDRFYIGDIGLGLLKLCTVGGFLFWAFLDFFLISGATRNRNYRKLQALLV